MRLSAFAATSPLAPLFARLSHALAVLGLACTLGYGVLATPAAAQDSDSNDTALMNLIAQASERVMLADTVARYKWAHRQAVADPAREQALLVTVAQQAPRYDVEPQLAQTFFRDQIEANKLVQQALIDGWRVAPPPPGPVPDLAASTRPQFDRLTGNLLSGLSRVEALRHANDCPVRLGRSLANWKELRTVDALHAQALARAFAHLCIGGGVGALG